MKLTPRNIDRFMLEHGLSSYQFSQKAGVSSTLISRLRSGTYTPKMRLKTKKKIREFLIHYANERDLLPLPTEEVAQGLDDIQNINIVAPSTQKEFQRTININGSMYVSVGFVTTQLASFLDALHDVVGGQ